jgi:two-component system, cell cycle sensor histidine kinase and response regulator CckA
VTPSPLRLLLVEDSPSDAKLIVETLKKANLPVEAERIEDEASLRAALASESFNVILADWSLPHFSALAALAVVKELSVDLPFIVVSGTIGEEAAVDALRRGAHDFVLKEHMARLAPAIERELREHDVRVAHRRALEALRQSEARHRVLFDGSPLPKWVFELDTLRFVEVNEAAVRTYGYSRDEFRSLTLRDIRPPEELPSLERVLPFGQDAPPTHGVYRHRKKDGTIFEAEVHGQTIRFGERHYRIAVIRDVTEHRRLEEQLRQSQKMEAVGRLAGGIAHDFNNLLSVILTVSELLLEEVGENSALRPDLLDVQRAGMRAADLTRQLLLFSRRQVLERRVIDLNALVVGMEKMMRRLVGEHIELVFAPAPTVGAVLADPGSVEQAIMNLVVNARDAMPQGGRVVLETADVVLEESDVSGQESASPGAHTMISLSDTGCGMTQETMSRMLEPFFTTKAPGTGTGLGLSTVLGIMQEARGAMHVTSAPGKGSRFELFFPHTKAALAAASSAAPPRIRQGHETVLLVEDDEAVRNVTATILRRDGYRLLVAATGEEAVGLSREHPGPIDLLVTDVVMPGVMGPDLARAIAERRPGIRVLCMTGYTEEELLQEALASGFAFLQKPVTREGLLRKVRELLDSSV